MKTPPLLKVLVLGVLSLGITSSAKASFMLYESTFTTSFADASNNFSGSFQVVFDTSLVTGSGTETFFSTEPADKLFFHTFSLNPDPYGLISYDISNVEAEIRFIDGLIDFLAVGGTTNPGAPYPGSNMDDFSVQYFVFHDDQHNLYPLFVQASSSNVGFQSQFGLQDDAPLSISSTTIPEPASAALLVGSGLLLVWRRRLS